MPSDILIVDDEADIREMVAGFLQDDGHRTRVARDSDEALKAIEERRPQLVILDIWLQGSRLDGLEVLNITKKAHPELPALPVVAYEIWNEPNGGWFWLPRPDPARYADMYIRARAAIKGVDPAAAFMARHSHFLERAE